MKAPPKENLNEKTSNVSNIYLKSKSAGSLIRKKNFQRQNSKDEVNKQQTKIKSFAKVPSYKLESILFLCFLLKLRKKRRHWL